MKAEQVAKAVEELEKLIKSEVRDETPKQSPADRRVAPGQISGTNALRHLLWCLMNVLQFMGDDRTEKAMRWLGFVQGALWMNGFVTIDRLKLMNKPEPKYFLSDPVRVLQESDAMQIIRAVQNELYVVDHNKVDPNKDVRGGDLVEMLAASLQNYGLGPRQLDDEPRKAEDPAPRGSKDWAGAQEAATKRISELERANSYLRSQFNSLQKNFDDELAAINDTREQFKIPEGMAMSEYIEAMTKKFEVQAKRIRVLEEKNELFTRRTKK